MNDRKYLGYLPQNDPLFDYLRYEIIPQMGVPNTPPAFRVYRLRASNHVYLYEDTSGEIRVIGKFFGASGKYASEAANRRMEREFNNLMYLRNLGFSGFPHYVPRPLGQNAWLNSVVIEEFCWGISLGEVILNAVRGGNESVLFHKITSLAYFLATMHNHTASEKTVDFSKDCAYFGKVAEQLRDSRYIGEKEFRDMLVIKDRWQEKHFMWEDRRVLVHGDVTPPNFLFGEGLWVIVLDVERMKLADRVFDVGRLAGEIKHFFMQYRGNKTLAEPFIRHFLREYTSHFPDPRSAFDSITHRLPFYMGLTLLRIARNSWIKVNYRRGLLNQAWDTLG